MKPPPVSHHGPETIEEAVRLLAELGAHAKVLAGGQSLVPLLNMRLTAPEHLVDVNRLGSLAYVRTSPEGVRVGATARHTDLERDQQAFTALPLLRRAVKHVAHPTIRNRGTTVGSLVHADPSGEMTAVLALLGGRMQLRSVRGERTVDAADFFVGPLESCVEPDELAVEAYFPTPRGRTGSDWQELSRRNGDYALCGVGTLVTVDERDRVVGAKAAYISVGPVPQVLDLMPVLAETAGDPRGPDWDAAGAYAAEQLSPEDDIHATAEYRRHLARVLTARSLKAALERAEVTP
jgi:carbon-monoxide dehydrogenase medium subunit